MAALLNILHIGRWHTAGVGAHGDGLRECEGRTGSRSALGLLLGVWLSEVLPSIPPHLTGPAGNDERCHGASRASGSRICCRRREPESYRIR